ncbi:hypothetical protein [Aliamphritea spongicola]|uniref:hypothetical protein n=1 Tax=Aliamphritea spongicola TaxID=707589 RepID=UPI00196BA386|nr:hypothetical protein [Aliamphritea spongicola]MBN3561210.1 hypothetical protein [Aliamphritea spongicola]
MSFSALPSLTLLFAVTVGLSTTSIHADTAAVKDKKHVKTYTSATSEAKVSRRLSDKQQKKLGMIGQPKKNADQLYSLKPAESKSSDNSELISKSQTGVITLPPDKQETIGQSFSLDEIDQVNSKRQ